MTHLLEDKLRNEQAFKSEGERKIAYFLDSHDIQYRYETGVLINSTEGKPRIWYPDFYLPEFAVYIEYFGLKGRNNYDRGIIRKEQVYSAVGLDVIPVYPWTFGEDWQGHIMGELYRITDRRNELLRGKPYRPVAEKSSYKTTGGSWQGYRRDSGGRYRS